MYVYFKQQIKEFTYDITWTWLRRGNLKGETGSLFF